MGDTSGFGGEWLFAFLVIAVLFGGGNFGFGGNAAAAGYATIADVNSLINNQSVQQSLNSALLSSQNNNYETAQLISGQNMQMMSQNNANLINAIQGFNTTNAAIANGFASVNQNIADLGYRMDRCCCDIKTTLLENRLADANAALLTSQTNNIVNAQSQYLLSQLGTYTPVVG